MIARKCTREDLEKALKIVNKKYNKNIVFNRLDFPIFTLKCKSSKGKGHRLGIYENKNGTRRKLINCCWHVHGDFFDALFKVNPEAYIYSQGRRIDISRGNWEDKQIGSMMRPLYFSEACECE